MGRSSKKSRGRCSREWDAHCAPWCGHVPAHVPVETACHSCSMKTSMGVNQGSNVNSTAVHACVAVHVASRRRSYDEDLHNEQRNAQRSRNARCDAASQEKEHETARDTVHVIENYLCIAFSQRIGYLALMAALQANGIDHYSCKWHYHKTLHICSPSNVLRSVAFATGFATHTHAHRLN